MFNQCYTPLIGETKEDFLRKLNLLYSKNDRIINLINIFNLEWACPPLEEYMNTEQIIIHLKNNKQLIKNNLKTNIMSNKAEKKYKNEIEETPSRSFVKFENIGDTIECVLIGRRDIKGNNDIVKSHVICVDCSDNEEKYLPTNIKLVNKLANLEKISGEFSETNKIECFIEYLGEEKIEGTPNKAKIFRLLTT